MRGFASVLLFGLLIDVNHIGLQHCYQNPTIYIPNPS